MIGRRIRWFGDPHAKPASAPDPSERARLVLSSRRACPSCACPDAEVLFQLPRCHATGCRFFDAGLPFSDWVAEHTVGLWIAAKRAESGA